MDDKPIDNGGLPNVGQDNNEPSTSRATVPTGTPGQTEKMIDIANSTFKSLCKTLEEEQSKLIQLENRRVQLQEEMQLLKMEIDDERNQFRLQDEATTAQFGLDELNVTSDGNAETAAEGGEGDGPLGFQQIDDDSMPDLGPLTTCFEVEEEDDDDNNDIIFKVTDLKIRKEVLSPIPEEGGGKKRQSQRQSKNTKK